MLSGFVLLGLAFGQSSGVVNSSFQPHYRYTGAAIVSNSAWFIGAGFAPLVALFLASRFGLWSVGLYLLSGVLCTLGALGDQQGMGAAAQLSRSNSRIILSKWGGSFRTVPRVHLGAAFEAAVRRRQ